MFRCTEMSLQRLQTFKQRGQMASQVVTWELTRLAAETHHSKSQMVRLGVLQGWKMLNQRKFRETRVWMDEMVSLCQEHQMEIAKHVKRLAVEGVAI